MSAATPTKRLRGLPRVGARVRHLGGSIGYGKPEEVRWIHAGTIGTVVELHEGSPAVTLGGERFEGIDPWCTVEYGTERGPVNRAISRDGRGKRWEALNQ